MNAVISGRAGLALLIEGDSLMSLDVDDLETLVPRRPSDLRFLLADAADLVTLENTGREEIAQRLDLEHDIACALDMTLIALDLGASMELRAEAVAALDELLADARVIERLEFTMYAKPLPGSADLMGALFCTEVKMAAARSFFERLSRYQIAIRSVREAWDALPDHLFGDDPVAKAVFHDAACNEGLFRLLSLSYGDQGEGSASLLEPFMYRSMGRLRNYRDVVQQWCATIHASPGLDAPVIDVGRLSAPPLAIASRLRAKSRSTLRSHSRPAANKYVTRYRVRDRRERWTVLEKEPNRTTYAVGRVVSCILLVLGSASIVVTTAWQRLDALGRGDAIPKVIDTIPKLLVNNPIAPLVALIAGCYLLLVVTSPTRKNPGVVDSKGSAYQAPASPGEVAAVSVLSGLALGALIVGILWLIPNRAQFRVTAQTGQHLTVAKDSKNLTITLTEIEPGAGAQKYLITATLSYDGEPDLTIRNAAEGDVFTYPKEHGYRIELLKTTNDNATFALSKNP